MAIKLELNGVSWTNVRHAAAGIVAAVAMTLAFAGPASAATYTPNTFEDEGAAGVDPSDCDAGSTDPCSLRDAVEKANSTEDDDEVVLSAGRYELRNVDEVSDANPVEVRDNGSLLVRGAGARQTTVDGNATEEDESRVFAFDLEANAELRDVAVTGGDVTGFSNGGAIKVRDNGEGGQDAVVTFTRVWLHGNHAGGDGGSISNRGKLTLVQSLVSGNTADGSGGGIENDDELTLINTTITGNEAQGDQEFGSLSEQFNDHEGNGGGIDNDGDNPDFEGQGLLSGQVEEEPAPDGTPFLRAENSTIAFNTAAGNGGGVSTRIPADPCEINPSFCEQLFQAETGGPIAVFHNTIVSDNTADGDTNCSGNQPADSGPWTSSEGYNLEDGDSCLFTAEGDLTKASGLAALADNGGGTDTHKLNDGSAAIDAAEGEGCPAVDQRGTARPQRNACDIGAFEREPDPEPEPEPKQEEQPQQPIPTQQTPEARGPRCLDTQPPLTNMDRDGLRVTSRTVTLSGISRDRGRPCASGVQRVEVSLARVSGTDLNCRFIRRSNRFVLSPFQNCRQPIRFVADGTTQWQFRFRVALKPGKYRAQARGYDQERNKETPKKRQNIVSFTVK